MCLGKRFCNIIVFFVGRIGGIGLEMGGGIGFYGEVEWWGMNLTRNSFKGMV